MDENLVIDGGVTTITDANGGADTYTISPLLSANVTINDTDGATIILPEGLDVTAATFSSTGVEFTVNGFTVAILAGTNEQADLFTFVFGGDPLDPTVGTSLNFEETATAFGAASPDSLAAGETSDATNTGEVQDDGSIGDPGNGGGGDPGDTFTLTTGPDNLTGTPDNDEFLAPIAQNPFTGGVSNTLASGDRVDGGSGNDSLYAEVSSEFLGVGADGADFTDIQPRLSNIQDIDIEARDFNATGTGARITVDAKNITDHVEIGSYFSDGDLTIENLTTLTSSGSARNTAEITVTMVQTDNFNSDGDASDLTVLFDNDYLLSGEVSEGIADYYLLDQDAELARLGGDADADRLDRIDRNGIRFETDGQEVQVEFDAALLMDGAPNEVDTHEEFVAALQQPLADLIADGTLPAGTQIVLFEQNNVIFDDQGLRLNQAALQDGSFSDLIPAVRVISGDGSEITPTGYVIPEELSGEFNVFGRFDQFFGEEDQPITVDIDLEKAGRGGEGGDLIIGGKAQSTSEGIAGGIEVFNINVIGVGGSGADAKPSNLGTITSTLNALTTVNIATDPAFVGGDSFASLVVRNGFDQDPNANIESGDLKLVDANSFLGNLTLGDGSATGLITNLDTLTALGGGDVTFNALLDGTETNQAYVYQTGAGDDSVSVRVDGDAVDFAESSLDVRTGGGNDEVLVNFDVIDVLGQNEQLNQTILDDVLIQTEAGNDTITIDDNVVGQDLGDANILAGDGDDVVYTDGTAAAPADQNALWAFNFDNARADAQPGGLGGSTRDDLPGVQTSLAYVGDAEVTVTLSGAGLANLAAGGGVMAVAALGAIAGDDGYEARSTVTVAGDNTYYGTQVDVTNAVLSAINDDPILGNLLEASIGANNTVVVESLTSGDFAAIDLRIEIDQEDATSDSEANAVLNEAKSVFGNSALDLNDLWGTTTFSTANPASYLATAPGADLTTSFAANAWYDGLSATGDAANSAVDNLHTAGSASTFEQDNTIDGGTGDDLIVLSTDAIPDPNVIPFTFSSNNAFLNGASNQTVVMEDSFGDDTVMNFTPSGVTALNAGIDFLDFTDYLTSEENQSATPGNESDTLIPVTLGLDTGDVQANEVSIVTFDDTDDAGETFASLTASVIDQLFNNDGTFTGFDGDSTYGNLGAAAATADDEYAEGTNTDDLINSAKSILMVEDADNDGEYKVFELTWNGNANADADGVNNGMVSATLRGSLDFGDSLVPGFTENNLVGSAAYNTLLANGLGGGTPDTTPPVFQSGAVDAAGTTLVLTYNEALNGGSDPATGAYTVTANGGAVAVNSVDAAGNTVTLTLGTAITQGQTVEVDYTPGASPVEDVAGNDAAALVDEAVTNNSTQMVPGAVMIDDPQDGLTFNANAGVDTFQFDSPEAAGYAVTIDDFSPGDVLDITAINGGNPAGVTVVPDGGNDADGMQMIQFDDPSSTGVVTLTLTGLTNAEDAGLFNAGSIDTVFGAGTLLV